MASSQICSKSDLRKQRLTELKSKARAGLADNRRQLDLERRSQHQSIENNASPIVDANATEEDPKKRLLNYTIEETERWNEAQERKKANSAEAGFHNFNHLASLTYKKELQNLKIDKEKYRKQGELRADAPKQEHDFDFTPSEEAKSNLIAAIQDSDKRKQKKRKSDNDLMAINDKNKQFNLKLQRDYDKTSS